MIRNPITRRVQFIVLPLAVAAVAGLVTFQAVNRYMTNQAAKDIRDVLLAHRGVHEYIQRTMHPEYYRALGDGEIGDDYYAPEILSSSFMVRVLHGYYNEERGKLGLPPVYYKLAADNPRNPVNRADAEERELLTYFRQHPEAKEIRKVVRIDGTEYLEYAMPFLRADQQCLVCHSTRDQAPAGLRLRYPGEGGFHERLGGLRAIETLRAPLADGHRAAYVAGLAALSGFVALGMLMGFNRTLSFAVRQKTAELSVRERTFRKLLDAAESVPFEYAPASDRYTFVGRQYTDLLGPDAPPPANLDDWDRFVHPDDRDIYLHGCREAVRNGEDHGCRVRLVRPDGRGVVAQMQFNSVREDGAEPVAVGFIHDVTGRVTAEAVQQARVTVAAAASDQGLDGLIRVLLDQAETLTESRIAFFHFVKDDQRTIVLRQWSTNTSRLCSSGHRGHDYALDDAGIWANAVRTGEVYIDNDYANSPDRRGLPTGHVELVRELVYPLRHDGRIVAVVGVGNKTVPYDERDAATLGQLVDFALEIILRKQAQEEAAIAQAQLVQAQKVEAIGRLAGGVAHDFNNMLGIILGHTQLLMDRVDRESPLHADLEAIEDATERSAAITRQLLAFARKQVASPRVLDLNEAIDGVLKMLRRLIGEDVDLIWKPAPQAGMVLIDPSQVDQIMANLAANARDAISGVGRLTIETGNVVFDEDYCSRHPGFRAGSFVRLEVSDSGQGIAREDLDHIFEPFFTTKAVSKGTGLGLAMVYGIVKQNNGFINVYSEPGEGTTFRIYLPRHVGEAERAAPPAARPECRGNETILLVEDEPAILRLASRILSGYGYNVLEAGSPAEALALAESRGGGADLLVTDMVMPGMNGRELAQRLGAIWPGLRSLFVSGYTADVIMHRGILEKGVAFMAKPYGPAELGARVREILDAG